MEQNKIVTTAVVLAAGQGKRMNCRTAKQYLLIDGKPVLYYSLKAFQDSEVDEIILVAGRAEQDYVRTEIVDKFGFTKVRGIVEGGRERYHSVYSGLKAARVLNGKRDAGGHYCYIHDGARPFVTLDIIERSLECARREKACVVGVPVKDTIKISDENGYCAATPKRSLVWMIQTPQVFSFPLILEAYEQLMAREEELLGKGLQITDDACVVELLTNQKVKMVEGSYQNIKITTPEDLKIAEMFLTMQ